MLRSVDLNKKVEISTVGELFDFALDELGLLKAAVIASGLVPPWKESEPEARIEHGFELVTRVDEIRVGSRLAVSTSLLCSCIAVLMRATGQISEATGPIESEASRLKISGRALLGEWLGGSGGGWQGKVAWNA